jgi:hypothetical protein
MKESVKGRLDYYLRPKLRDGRELFSMEWRGTGPMNGQPSRQNAVQTILEKLPPPAIIETGTYRGITTEWFAQFGVPVHTIEVNPRLHAYASTRLRKHRNVTCHLGRSVDVMKTLAPEPESMPKPGTFFYLDAHWDADVPVVGELDQIFLNWPRPIILIDDFQVPGQSYHWLDRGPGHELTADILGDYGRLSRWYPSTPAYQEAGMNTGWTIIAPGYEYILDSIGELTKSV